MTDVASLAYGIQQLIDEWQAKATRRYDDAERLRGVEEDVRADKLKARADECRAHV